MRVFSGYARISLASAHTQRRGFDRLILRKSKKLSHFLSSRGIFYAIVGRGKS